MIMKATVLHLAVFINVFVIINAKFYLLKTRNSGNLLIAKNLTKNVIVTILL
jgi:hypothetical protein